MKIKKILLIICLVAIFTSLSIGRTQAVLQANPNSNNKTELGKEWLSQVRTMEATGGAMGLDEKVDDALNSTTGSNNLDVHMMKSTEYGAMAILSASGYGNPGQLQNSTIKTTTGNKTGIYLNENAWVYVAGGNNVSYGKYFDTYISNDRNSAKVGDALGKATTTNQGCANWHGTTFSNWFVEHNSVLARAGYNEMFGYGYQNDLDRRTFHSFATVVCGEGI